MWAGPTAGAEPLKPHVQAARTAEKLAPSAPFSLPAQDLTPSSGTPALKLRVLGVAGYQDRQGRQVWRYLLESGELLTAAQIAGRYGLSVQEVREGGVMRLVGQGVTYGPSGD